MSSIFPFDDSIFQENPLPDLESGAPDLNYTEELQLPDGSSVFKLVREESEESNGFDSSEDDFYENLAHKIGDATLSVLGSRLIEEVKQDIESRAEWEKPITIAMKYLGFRIEEFKNVPFMRACGAYDSTLAKALFRSFAVSKAELFPAAGPIKTEVIGVPQPDVEDRAERVKMFGNFYLTNIDKDYYPDSDKLLLYTTLCGSGFRKVYQDPILEQPIARMIPPQDFIINNDTISVMNSSRVTHRMFLNRREILLRQKSGDFIEFDLPAISDEDSEESPLQKTVQKMDGISKGSQENKSLFTFYEVHVDLKDDELRDKLDKKKKNKKKDKSDNIPRPYVVTICEAVRKVVSVKRNWKEGDDKYTKNQYFVGYQYMPGFGIYGLGLAHFMGSSAITLTQILRQQMDAELLKTFPGGLRQKGMRIEKNDKAIGPAEFHEVETGGRPIQETIMLMPYAGASQIMMALRDELKQEADILSSTVESQLPDLGSNAPVGTTMAMIEVSGKAQSTVLRSFHNSLKEEFKLLFKLFAENMDDEPYPFAVPGKNVSIMKTDFSDNVNIIPVSDPNVLTSTHRLLRTEAEVKLAQSAPQLHNMREVYRRMYEAMGITNVDKILIKEDEPLPLDAETENMNALLGKKLKVALFQDDESHIVSHLQWAEDNAANPNAAPAIAEIMIHVQEHEANKIFKQLQHQLQQNMLPPLNVPEDQIRFIPEIQNEVSRLSAQKAMQKKQAMQQQQQQQMQQMQEDKAKQIDPNSVMMADIEQRREAAHLKHEESKLRAETDSFKAQLNFETEKSKQETERDLAEQKSEVDLTIADMKQPKPPM